MKRLTFGIRGRVLAIALIPSFALLAAGVTGSGYFFVQGIHARDWTDQVRQAGTGLGVQLSKNLQQERLLTLARLAGDQHNPAALVAQRQLVDHILQVEVSAPDPLRKMDPAVMDSVVATFVPLAMRYPAIRQQIDAGTLPVQDAYTFYNQLVGTGLASMVVIARTSPDARTAAEESRVSGLFNATEAMSRSAALAAQAVLHGGLSGTQLSEYGIESGYYHAEVSNLLDELPDQERTQLRALITSPEWNLLSTIEDTIIRHGSAQPGDYPPISTVVAWENAATVVNGKMFDLTQSQQFYTLTIAADAGQRIERNSLLAGGGVLLLSLAAFVIALWLSSRLIARLKRLRGETLALADQRLPDLMSRLRAGENVDVDAEVAQLDHGSDEIGQVADAFNRAQHAAVSAAVTEAQTREGVRAVFLNIAHRSQIVVHRQLEILDKAEHRLEDPTQLEMLFQLDHLATRERRNAENLIILGGEQPGRRWRRPVPLVELVRSAVAETEDYARVRLTKFPELSIVGSVVADLIHLLAELVDNATSFSPPESPVEASGHIVGRGVVIEVSDQGLGMTEDEMKQLNATLHNPPDFSVATLSSDSRLGLFVVALLANRNNISVRLVESDYGGIRAIVLVPSPLVAVPSAPAEPVSAPAETPEYRYGSHVRIVADELQAGDSDANSGPGQYTQLPYISAVPEVDADGRPLLPRRSRQAHLAQPLTQDYHLSTTTESDRPAGRSAESARDLLSAIADGTRQGRHVQAEPFSTIENSNLEDDHGGPFQGQ